MLDTCFVKTVLECSCTKVLLPLLCAVLPRICLSLAISLEPASESFLTMDF